MQGDRKKVESIIARYPNGRDSLTEILLDVKEEVGTLSDEVIRIVSGKLGLSPIEVQGVASFYASLGSPPRGEPERRRSSCEFDPWSRHPCKKWRPVGGPGGDNKVN